MENQNLTTDEWVSKLITDMYFGADKDNPSMTTRVYTVELALGRLTTMGAWIIGLLITAIVTSGCDFLFHVAK